MPNIDLDNFAATVENAAKFNNQLTKIEQAANAMDADNWGPGKIFDPAKLTTAGTSENDALVHNGSAWSAQAIASVVSPSWTSYTPVLTASSSNPNLGSGATQQGAYVQMGKLVIGYAHIVFGSSPSNGSGSWSVSLPVTGASTPTGALGIGYLFDASGTTYELNLLDPGTHDRVALAMNTGLVSGGSPITTIAQNDQLSIFFAYEAA